MCLLLSFSVKKKHFLQFFGIKTSTLINFSAVPPWKFRASYSVTRFGIFLTKLGWMHLNNTPYNWLIDTFRTGGGSLSNFSIKVVH